VEEKRQVLVVEDEEAIRRGVCDLLVFHGYLPIAASRGDEGLALALSRGWGLVILDLMLPGINGLDVCRRLRAAVPAVPILMLTAKGAEDDVVAGLEAGADDYVTKPFSVRELMARVEALMRRSLHLGAPPACFSFGPWTVDPRNRMAEADGRQVQLTDREVDLLALFSRQRGQVVSRETLLQSVWGVARPDELFTRTVDVHIAKLRKKIDRPRGPSLLETVRGAGYRASG
jgi:two-component system response regulator RegX3